MRLTIGPDAGQPGGGRARSWTVAELSEPDGERVIASGLGSAQLAEVVAARERDTPPPRWVWAASTAVYPTLLKHGVTVSRCHDLDSTERLLLAHEERWSELETAAADLGLVDAANRGSGAPTLFDTAPLFEATPGHDDVSAAVPNSGAGSTSSASSTAEIGRRDRDQRARIAQARQRVPGFALLVAAESASTLLAIEMGRVGIPWDRQRHDALLTDLLGPKPGHGRPARLAEYAAAVAQALEDPRVNPDSPADLLRSLRRAGLPVNSTGRHELARHDHPVVPLLRQYKELARLWTANGWAWADTWVRDGRFRPEYVPAGVISGRWATRGGGALQIPKAIRGAVQAPPGRVLVLADAGQLEPRVLAALSADTAMIAATRAGDLYTALAADALQRPDARAEAKVGLLAAMYGGGGRSPALAALRRSYPQALALLEDAAQRGEDGRGVRSILGRACPPAEAGWLDGLPESVARTRARSRGRFTRNFVVQASAADWAAVWLASLRRRLADLNGSAAQHHHCTRADLVFFQHDEVIVEADIAQADQVIAAIKDAGAEATSLVLGDTGVSVPLEARAANSYADKQ